MPIHNTGDTTDVNTEMTTPSSDYAPSARSTPSHPDAAHALPAPHGLPAGARIALIVIAVIVLAGVTYRILGRAADERHLNKQTQLDSIPTVDVISPVVSGVTSELALPGNTQAFDDTPIYARTSGYLKQWFVDIGQHVTKGELMATIETPELDQQLQVAQADLKSAQADLNLAKTTSDRYTNLLKLK